LLQSKHSLDTHIPTVALVLILVGSGIVWFDASVKLAFGCVVFRCYFQQFILSVAHGRGDIEHIQHGAD
jgi:hypothetical protein